MSFDTYQAVTDEITAALESGVIPWHRPWNGGVAPSNLVSRKPYRGVNTLLLSLNAKAETPYWLTFKQAKQLGGSVRRGEHGAMVVFFKQLEIQDRDTGEDRTIPMLRYYRVFNAAQCDGIDVPASEVGEGPTDQPNDIAQALIDKMPGAPTLVHGGHRAFYQPSTDRVTLPERMQFESLADYYVTALHELTHSTGHASRLNRFDNDTEWSRFGSEPYGREELVAELGAAFLGNVAGIDHVAPSASYIDGWLRAIKRDKRLIVSAASRATAAADHIRGL